MINFNYSDALNEYKKSIAKYPIEVKLLRQESHVESLKDWCEVGDIEDLKAWFQKLKRKSSMNVIEIPLNQCDEWGISENASSITHSSGKFFEILGVRVTNSVSREAHLGWDQPIVKEHGYDGGVLGLLRKKINGIPHYLIEAKAEPGNYGLLQISPSLQATFSNLEQAHGGRKPYLSDIFLVPESINAKVIFDQWLPEDGGRLMKKRNKGMMVEVDEEFELPSLPNTFRWVSLYQLKMLIEETSWVNPHVRSLISFL